MNEWGYRNFGNTNKEEETMNRQQVIKALKDILMSNDFEGKEQQENALIIAIAELLKE